jgi:undecaprenyl-diphosphatase
MDYQLFQLINRYAGQTPILDAIMHFLVSDYLLSTAIGLMGAGLWFAGATPVERRPNQRAVLQAGVSLLLANALVKLANLVYFRPRPFTTHEVNLLFYRPSDSSLPSNPAAAGFSLAVAVWLTHRRAGMTMLALATVWSLARIYCGVHYPLDVITGVVVGGLAAYFIVRRAPMLNRIYDWLIVLGERLFLK